MHIKLISQAEFDARAVAATELANVRQLDAVLVDGSIVITVDPDTAARLAGRSEFGPILPVQSVLRDRIARAWELAGCPA